MIRLRWEKRPKERERGGGGGKLEKNGFDRRNKYTCRNIFGKRIINIQGTQLERVKFFVKTEIIEREGNYLPGRGHSHLDNFLQEKYCPV